MMSLKRTILAGLAAGGLLVSQSAAAASLPTRTGADFGQAEELAGTPAAAWPAVAAILALLLLFGVIALTDDDEDDFPTSP